MLSAKLALAAVALAGAAAAAGDPGCNKVGERQVYDCALKARDAADKDLNEAYRQAMAVQEDEQAQAKLKAAERIWLQFRDAECTFEDAIFEGGKIETEVNNLCVAQLTRDRTAQLRRYLACQKDAMKCAE